MGLYSRLRSAHWLSKGYPADRYARVLSMAEGWSRQQMEKFRNKKLQALIRHCYDNVPYYRRIMEESQLLPADVQTAQDLSKLPILTKEHIRAHRNDLMAKNIQQMKISWSKTGGTTGEPMQVCKNEECGAWASMCYERGLRWGGLTVDQTRILLYGGTLGIDKQRIAARIGLIFRRNVFIPAFELRRDTAPHFFDKIRRSHCRFLLGYASSIYRLAVLAEEMNEDVTFDAVFPTAELLMPDWEDVIRRVLKCKILPYYGCGEVYSLGYQKPGSSDYYIPDEHVVIEVMKGNGSTELLGEGSFLITDLDNYAMPIIRYGNGDAGKIAAADGQGPFSRIERLDGRYNSFLMTDKGELISGVIGTHVFRHFPAVQIYRVIQEDPLRLVIKIVPRSDFTTADEKLIASLFSKYLGTSMKITIEKVPDIPVPPSGKSVFVVNHCL